MAGFAVSKFRDLSIVRMPGTSSVLVVSCDSFGGIGSRKADVVKMDGCELGKKIIRVPLMELLAAGATPFLIIDNLGMAAESGGSEVMSGIRDELTRLGLDPEVCMNGSTEDNIPTIQSFAGVVAMGTMPGELFLSKSVRVGDVALCIGTPKSGPKDKILLGDPEIVTYEDLLAINASGLAHDILPVGSHGIEYELRQMAESRGRSFRVMSAEIDMKKSAGIATCVIVALKSGDVEAVQRIISTKSTLVAEFT